MKVQAVTNNLQQSAFSRWLEGLITAAKIVTITMLVLMVQLAYSQQEKENTMSIQPFTINIPQETLEERAPHAKILEREEALTELVKRYFSSHGPATLQDFVWWSGLTVTEAKVGLEHAKSHLGQETIEGQTYWFSPDIKSATSTNVHLLPWFDEFLVAYKDRSAVLNLANTKQVNAGGGMLNPTIISHGQVVGTWKSILKKDTATLRLTSFRPLEETEKDSLAVAAERYGTFLAKSLSWT